MQRHESFAMASANLIGINAMPAAGANVYDILRADTLVLTRAGLLASWRHASMAKAKQSTRVTMT